MKQQMDSKSPPRISISIRRKIRIYVDRSLITSKLLILCVLCLLMFTSYLDHAKQLVKSYLIECASDFGLKLENVIVSGQRNLSTPEIVSYLNADVGTPIFSLPLDSIRMKLEQNDWVKDAVIERRLPSTIYIEISEREPIAIWQYNQKLSLIDIDSHVIHTDNIKKFVDLIHVVGADAHLHAGILEHNLLIDPALKKRVVSAVRYGERRWNLILDQDITIKMPTDQEFRDAYTYLSKLYKSGKLFDSNYKAIDLRDKTKYYIESVAK